MSSSSSSLSSPLLANAVTEDEQEEATTTATMNKALVVETNKKPSLSASSIKRLIGRFLERYTRIVGSSLNRDRLLKTAQYTLWWYSLLGASKAAETLCWEVCWARYITRAAEWPTALEGLWNDSWAPVFGGDNNNSNSQRLGKLERTLGRLLAASMVVYYPAEHAAYGHWKVLPQSTGQRVAEMYSAWSCRAWLVYILTDIVQGYIALTTPTSLRQQEDKEEDGDNKEALALQQKRRHKQQVVMLRNVLFLLPAYHWSLPNWDRKPWLKSTTVNSLMWLEAILSLYQTSLEVE